MNLFGHPIHPMLVPLPMGGFVFSLGSLVVYTVTRDPFWLTAAYWLSITGVAAGLLAAAFGLADWLGIPGDSRNKAIGAWHMAINLTLVGIFFVSWLLLGGFGGTSATPDATLPLLLQLVGIALLGASGWLGGEIVYGKPAEKQEAQPAPDQQRRDAA
jgi:uncharacterized membrane protein